MSRYIDADAFIKLMEENCDHSKLFDELALKLCKGAISEIPTADVVKVVRCKDCKWYEPSRIQELRESGMMCCYFHVMHDRKIGFPRTDDDYCSKAERKEVKHEQIH